LRHCAAAEIHSEAQLSLQSQHHSAKHRYAHTPVCCKKLHCCT